MKFRINDRQRSVGIMIIWIFTICLLIGIAIWRFSALTAILRKILSVLAPIIWGLVIAYLLTPMKNWIEKQAAKLIEKKKPHPTVVRIVGVAGSILILLAALTGLIAMLLPELYSSLKSLMLSLPDYMTSASQWVSKRIEGLEHTQPQMYGMLTTSWTTIQSKLANFADEFQPKLENLSDGADLLSTITSGAVTVVNAMKNFLLGILVAVYLLYDKEKFQAQTRRLMYAFLPREHVAKILSISSHVSYSFMHFLTGKSLDSLVIGMLCFIGMTILKMPYAALISLIVGITNIIPFFGPIIGAIPSGVLILLSTPSKVIPFAIFILVLQQFDGNILGPKILGGSLGLPTFWVLFAIFVGGGLFGFIGMVAFIPLFAALFTLASDFLRERLTARGLPYETEHYMDANNPPVPVLPKEAEEEGIQIDVPLEEPETKEENTESEEASK